MPNKLRGFIVGERGGTSKGCALDISISGFEGGGGGSTSLGFTSRTNYSLSSYCLYLLLGKWKLTCFFMGDYSLADALLLLFPMASNANGLSGVGLAAGCLERRPKVPRVPNPPTPCMVCCSISGCEI